MKKWIRGKILGFLGLEARLLDIERHFITKRDERGAPIETLADIPIEKRKEIAVKPRGMSWAQQRAWLEKTEGGTKIV
jgi:hypothetical protein